MLVHDSLPVHFRRLAPASPDCVGRVTKILQSGYLPFVKLICLIWFNDVIPVAQAGKMVNNNFVDGGHWSVP